MSTGSPIHPMRREIYDGRESLFVCEVPGCGHQLVLDHATGGAAIAQRGPDPFARHVGSTPGVSLSAAIVPGDPSQAA